MQEASEKASAAAAATPPTPAEKKKGQGQEYLPGTPTAATPTQSSPPPSASTSAAAPPAAAAAAAAAPVTFSSEKAVYYVLDRRVRVHPNVSLYATLRSWVLDDPRRPLLIRPTAGLNRCFADEGGGRAEAAAAAAAVRVEVTSKAIEEIRERVTKPAPRRMTKTVLLQSRLHSSPRTLLREHVQRFRAIRDEHNILRAVRYVQFRAYMDALGIPRDHFLENVVQTNMHIFGEIVDTSPAAATPVPAPASASDSAPAFAPAPTPSSPVRPNS